MKTIDLKKKLQSIRRCLRMVHELDRRVLPLLVVKGLIAAAAPYAGILLGAYALDQMSVRAPLAQALPVVIALAATVFLLGAADAVLKRVCGVLGDRVYYSFQYKTGEKTMTMNYPQAEDPSTAKLRDRITQDQNWGGGMWSVMGMFGLAVQGVFGLLAAVVLLIARFAGTAVFRTWSTPVYILVVTVVTLLLSGLGARLNAKIFRMLDSVTGAVRLFFFWLFEGGMTYRQGKEIRVYGMDRLIRQQIDEQVGDVRKLMENRASSLTGGANAVRGTLSALVEGGAYLFVALLASKGALGIGSVFLFAGVLQRFSSAIVDVALHASELSISCARMDSNFEYFNLPDTMHRGTLPVEKRADDRYEIAVNHVSFKYPGSEEYVLKDVTLKIKIGERLAVVGRNGSGKTTLIKLLCRLYEPTEGNITLNGIDIRKYDEDEYRGIFSVVFQDFSLPALELGVDVACAREYDRARAERSLGMSGFGERLAAFPEGLDTALYKDYAEDGVELSGGEAQKVALARALYRGAPFVILDEPTAALDPIAEFDVYARFDEIVGGRTAVFISHRLSSCRFCHDIAVFDEGRLVQRGSHEALLEQGGRYRELWNAQAQYYA